jgi:hypothetical protein
MENKLSAVNWLINQLHKKQNGDFSDISYDQMFDQAKAMDKEQKQNMFNCGRQYQSTGEGTFKEVYEEIYGDK